MRLTEKEASKKTCPFMTYCVNPDQAGYHNFPIIAQESCQGSSCMAWAWHDKSMRKSIRGGLERPCTVPENWTYCPEDDDYSCWVEPETEWTSRQEGYCRRLYEKGPNT